MHGVCSRSSSSPPSSHGGGRILRRERATLIGEILEVVASAKAEGEDRLTRLAIRVNMPYDRFVEYLVDLEQKGLLERDPKVRLTHKGSEMLRRFRGWREALRLFGFDTREQRTHDS
jgi:predicted transcriptional regulator